MIFRSRDSDSTSNFQRALICLSVVLATVLAVGCGKSEPESEELSPAAGAQQTESSADGAPAIPEYKSGERPAAHGDNAVAPMAVNNPQKLAQAKAKEAAKNVTWHRWRGPSYDGKIHGANWRWDWNETPPKEAWKARVGIGFSSMAVTKDRVFTMGNGNGRDRVSCLSVEDGRLLWKFEYPAKVEANLYEGGPNATPTVDGNRVYTISKQGLVLCLNVETGKPIWSKNVKKMTSSEKPEWGFSGSPLIWDEQVILNVGKAGLSLDRRTGEKVWFNGGGVAGYSSPMPFYSNGRELVVMFSATHLLAVDPANKGKGAWSHKWLTQASVNAADPVVIQNNLFVSSGYGKGCAILNFAKGRPLEVWKTSSVKNHFSSSVAMGNYIYGIDGQNGNTASLVCLEPSTGKRLWLRPRIGSGSLIGVGNHLLVLNNRGELQVVEANPIGYKLISKARVLDGRCWTPPAFSQGRIYCRNASGDLVCLDVRIDIPEDEGKKKPKPKGQPLI